MTAKVHCAAPDAAGNDEAAVALVIHIEPAPVYGEVATRSRVGCNVVLEEQVTFALRRGPSAKVVVLEMDGIEFRVLPQVAPTRRRVKRELGSDWGPEAAYEWWMENRHQVAPLESSKMHRVLESIMGMRSFQATVPHYIKVSTVWAMLHATSTSVRCFEFWDEGADGVRITARRREPPTALDAEDRETMDGILKGILVRDQALGEVFAATSFNFMRLIHGHTVGQPGASAAKLTKMLTAVKTWGPGKDGWQMYDDTWQAVDQKNAFGRTVAEQGRILWHTTETK